MHNCTLRTRCNNTLLLQAVLSNAKHGIVVDRTCDICALILDFMSLLINISIKDGNSMRTNYFSYPQLQILQPVLKEIYVCIFVCA